MNSKTAKTNAASTSQRVAEEEEAAVAVVAGHTRASAPIAVVEVEVVVGTGATLGAPSGTDLAPVLDHPDHTTRALLTTTSTKVVAVTRTTETHPRPLRPPKSTRILIRPRAENPALGRQRDTSSKPTKKTPGLLRRKKKRVYRVRLHRPVSTMAMSRRISIVARLIARLI